MARQTQRDLLLEVEYWADLVRRTLSLFSHTPAMLARGCDPLLISDDIMRSMGHIADAAVKCLDEYQRAIKEYDRGLHKRSKKTPKK